MSKNKLAPTQAERLHIARIKEMDCAVCDLSGPTECHEMEQGVWWLSIPLCADCHRGSFNGLHGQRRAWIGRKMGEIDALAVTIQRLMA